jgi:hypothetical protein
MRLKLLAPFRSHFRLSLGYTLKTGRLSAFSQDYLDFWDRVQRSVSSDNAAGTADIRCLHSEAHLGPDTIRYTSIDSDTLRYTAELIDIQPTGSTEVTDLRAEEFSATVNELANRRVAGYESWNKLVQKAALIPESTTIRVFDNNISLLEAELDVSHILAGIDPDEVDAVLDDLREFAVFCGEALIKHYYAALVFSVLRSITEDQDVDHVFTDPLYVESHAALDVQGLQAFEYPLQLTANQNHQPPTEVLWVTRSLVCDIDDAADLPSRPKLPLSNIATTWLRSVGDNEQVKELAQHDDMYSTRWLNYLFREKFVVKNGGKDFFDVWGAMQLCQYYYSAVENLNDKLNRVLSIANQDRAKGNLRDLHNYLDDIVRRCELVLASYNEMQKYFNRDKYNAFREILEYWQFDVMEAQVREKMSVCRSRLDSLSRQSSEKGRLYTDILLIVVSLLTLLDMSITLALFGRSPTDTVYAQDATYSGVILAWFARQQPHIIIFSAFVLVMLLGLRFYFFRRKRLLYD